MASFDPSKYQRIVKPGVQSSGGFDPSKYQRIVKPQTDKSFLESLKQQSWEVLKQQPLIAADIAGGVRAGLQNPISQVTSYLPQGMQAANGLFLRPLLQSMATVRSCPRSKPCRLVRRVLMH